MIKVPKYYKDRTIIWNGWNTWDVYNLFPSEYRHRIKLEKNPWMGYNLIIYGLNFGGGSFKYVAKPGDAICYDNGLGDDVKIFKANEPSFEELFGDTYEKGYSFNFEDYMTVNNIKQDMIKLFLGTI